MQLTSDERQALRLAVIRSRKPEQRKRQSAELYAREKAKKQTEQAEPNRDFPTVRSSSLMEQICDETRRRTSKVETAKRKAAERYARSQSQIDDGPTRYSRGAGIPQGGSKKTVPPHLKKILESVAPQAVREPRPFK